MLSECMITVIPTITTQTTTKKRQSPVLIRGLHPYLHIFFFQCTFVLRYNPLSKVDEQRIAHVCKLSVAVVSGNDSNVHAVLQSMVFLETVRK